MVITGTSGTGTTTISSFFSSLGVDDPEDDAEEDEDPDEEVPVEVDEVPETIPPVDVDVDVEVDEVALVPVDVPVDAGVDEIALVPVDVDDVEDGEGAGYLRFCASSKLSAVSPLSSSLRGFAV